MVADIPSEKAKVALDPFFDLSRDSEWNACIGRQGDEENYVDGYMEAALELVSAVIDKRQYAKRDTLAMPILYNARHAVELTLKYVIDRLHACGIIGERAKKNHDILEHWHVLEGALHGDSDLRVAIAEMKPFVDSLRGIDEDGQELRYAETQDGKKSLENMSLCNLEHVREHLEKLGGILERLKFRTIGLMDERRTGSFTADLSRRDLYRLTEMLPPRNQWVSEDFTKAKEAAMARFGIGSRRFSDAVNLITRHREMGGILGIEFELAHLTDDRARVVMSEWAKINPPRAENDRQEIDYFKRDWSKFVALQKIRAEAERVVSAALSCSEVADLQTVYYLGRDGRHGFCEDYEARLATNLKIISKREVAQAIHDLMSKTNLLSATVQGLQTLGRTCLANELRALRPDVFAN